MIAASEPIQRRRDAKLLLIDAARRVTHLLRSDFASLVRRFDVVVANDAATLPASLAGTHERTGQPIEIRLAARSSLDVMPPIEFVAVVFGRGDFRTRTEDRRPPPLLRGGDRLTLGPLHARVEQTLDHPRLIIVRFDGDAPTFWRALAQHGRPIQYAHVEAPLALWDVWTPVAATPFAFEPPSAGFIIDWQTIAAIRARGAAFATLTHAAGLSSTGDAVLDARLPLHEPYRSPVATVAAIERARERSGRVIAIGTTVVRALEHSASQNGVVRAGDSVATQRLGAHTRLRVVDAIVSGTHEPGTSHYELLRAFVDDATLRSASTEFDARGYRTHEFGDSVFIERSAAFRQAAKRAA